MIDNKMALALNEQINKEIYASYLYLAMAAYAVDINMDGAATWLKHQAQEEMEHAMKFYGYLVEQGARVQLKAIAEPPGEYASLLQVFEKVYEHEQLVTKSINDLMTLAIDLKDYATQGMLQWFIKEQVEEEASASGTLEKLKMAGTEGRGLLIIDRYLGARGQS